MSGSPHGVRGGTYGFAVAARAGVVARAPLACCPASGVAAIATTTADTTAPVANHCLLIEPTLQESARVYTPSERIRSQVRGSIGGAEIAGLSPALALAAVGLLRYRAAPLPSRPQRSYGTNDGDLRERPSVACS